MPPQPVSHEAALVHREAMKVRKIQEAAEAAGSDFWESVEADPNFDYDDWVVKHAESSLLVSKASDNHKLHHNEDFHLQ